MCIRYSLQIFDLEAYLIFKNKMAITGIFFFDDQQGLLHNLRPCWKGIIGRVLKFAGYVLHYKSLLRNILGLVLKNKMAAIGVFSMVIKEFAHSEAFSHQQNVESLYD